MPSAKERFVASRNSKPFGKGKKPELTPAEKKQAAMEALKKRC